MSWNLLIVDDEPANLEIIGEFLDDPAYRLTFATNGEEAWTELLGAAVPIDLIVLDRMMPVLNGMELLRRVKADPRFRDLPVIMQTAASDPAQIQEGLDAGAYYYLTKPYHPTALLSIVSAAIDGLVQRQEAVRATLAYASGLAEIGPDFALPATIRFSSLDEAHHLAGALASLCPDPAAVAMGLTELLVNAIEHGNLGITYAEKKMLRQQGGWEDEVARRRTLPEYCDRVASIVVSKVSDAIAFSVEDDGSGFDWRKYLDFDPDRAFDPNGRGIAMAGRIGFSRLEYCGCGNHVVATVSLGAAESSPGSAPLS